MVPRCITALLLLLAGTAHAVITPAPNSSVAMLDRFEFHVVLDVRSASEYAAGHIEGAMLMSETNLTALLACHVTLKVAVYCWTGYDRSTPQARRRRAAPRRTAKPANQQGERQGKGRDFDGHVFSRRSRSPLRRVHPRQRLD